MENQIMHWTAKSAADFVFSVGADFVAQVEVKMETENMPQKDLAMRLQVSEGRVSQILNDPGNLELETIVNCALSLGMKASIVLYDDGDRKKEYGPIHPQIFRICWEKAGKPKDFWQAKSEWSEGASKNYEATLYIEGSNIGYVNRETLRYSMNSTGETITRGSKPTATNTSPNFALERR